MKLNLFEWKQTFSVFCLVSTLQGNFTIENLQIDESFYPKILPTGENVIDIEYYVGREKVIAMRLFSDIKHMPNANWGKWT